jgi:hypothetical protein
MKTAFASLAVCLLGLTPGCRSIPTLTDPAQIDSFVGRRIRIVGEVSNTKASEILGIEVESYSPDLRGQVAEAEGVLERHELTKEEFDKMWREMGPFQSRGPGVFYRLRTPVSNETAKAKKPN